VLKARSRSADASYLVVFAINKNLTALDVGRHRVRIAEVRGVPPESLTGLRERIVGFLDQPKSEFDVNAWAERRASGALTGSHAGSLARLGSTRNAAIPSRH